MHAHERTMLARLGFADPDRQDPRHDLACQYVAQPETVAKFVHLLELTYEPRPFRHSSRTDETTGTESSTIHRRWVASEMPIEKGSGQYKTTVGFLDVLLGFELLKHKRDVRWRRRNWSTDVWSEWRHEPHSSQRTVCCVGVEVKIAPVPIGALVRQINLYRSYTEPGPYGHGGIARWAVVTDYGISAANRQSLENERIVPVRLGSAFEQFVQASAQGGPDPDAVEI